MMRELEGDIGVMLVEADFEFGGGMLSSPNPVEGLAALEWRDAALARLRAMPNVELRSRSMAFGFYDHNMVAIAERVTDHLPPHARSGPRQRL